MLNLWKTLSERSTGAFALLAFLAVLTFCQSAEAQPIPTWKNDAQGRPAPPCMVLDPTTGFSTPCTATNPLPTVGGGGTGTGTTSGTSTTGFGRAWFPSTITGAVAAGQQMIATFIDDLQVAFFRRSTGCGNCLEVAVSTDGGVTGSFFATAFAMGNSISAAHRVPFTTPRYLVSSIQPAWGQSANVSSGYTAITGLTVATGTFASNPTGTTTLAFASIGGVNTEVCRSTNQGISFSGCITVAGGQLTALSGMGGTHVTGTTWLFYNQNGQVLRSTNDGLSFAVTTTQGGSGRAITCFPNSNICHMIGTDQIIRRSTDGGLTFAPVQTGVGPGATTQGLCSFNNTVNAALLPSSPPVGLATITQATVWSTPDSGVAWYPGTFFGSHWDGTGAPSLNSMSCRNGRGVATWATTGGGVNVFAAYNPITAPGSTLTSSAGGYNVSAPIQSGIILNAAPITSAANTAAVVTLTGTAGSRVCLRSITLFSSAAGAATLTITDGATVVRNFGSLVTGTSAALTTFTGTPMLCGQTSNSLVVNIGAAGAAVTTTTSVIADRYPN